MIGQESKPDGEKEGTPGGSKPRGKWGLGGPVSQHGTQTSVAEAKHECAEGRQ